MPGHDREERHEKISGTAYVLWGCILIPLAFTGMLIVINEMASTRFDVVIAVLILFPIALGSGFLQTMIAMALANAAGKDVNWRFRVIMSFFTALIYATSIAMFSGLVLSGGGSLYFTASGVHVHALDLDRALLYLLGYGIPYAVAAVIAYVLCVKMKEK